MKESRRDKQWAKAYILDPLTAPEPSQDTGIGSVAARFNSFKLAESKSKTETPTPSKDIRASTQTPPRRSYPTPPSSASPSRSSFHPSNPFHVAEESNLEGISPPRSPPISPSGAFNNSRRYPPNSSVTRSASARVPHMAPNAADPRHQRSQSTGSCEISRNRSISQRFPGDMSHRPLDMIRKETRAADRAPHLRRKHLPHTDIIDSLDTIGGTYHHGGPYDAALASRNRTPKYSPVAAVHDSNMEAIRATPREFVEDSLRRNRPLQGTALIPNGAEDFRGNVMKYEEGADLMREPDAAGGAYKRWEGIEYHPDDLKGKGPNFEKERDLKEKKRIAKGQPSEYELQSRHPEVRVPLSSRRSSNEQLPSSGLARHNSTGKRISDGLKRRFGSIRRKKEQAV